MKYTVATVYEKVQSIGGRLHASRHLNTAELKQIAGEAHNYIANSDISYSQAYTLIKTITTNQEEFNERMGRVRETVIKRNKEVRRKAS